MNTKKILIAEDDKFLIRVYKAKLFDLGYEIILLEDGKDVLSKAKETKPDLIIVDIIMPVRDGYEAIEDLQGDSETKDIPVIVLSNLSQEDDKKKARELGVKDFLVKSDLSFDTVMEKINAILN